MNLHGNNFVGDQLSPGSGEMFYAMNPAGGSRLEPGFHAAGEKEVNGAMDLAQAAFASYRQTTNEQRAIFLERIADEIMALGDALILRAREETGLGEARLVGERARTVNQFKMFAGLMREGSWVDARIDTAIPDRQPVPKVDLRWMLIPIGPVVVFGSSNFPFAYSVAGGDTASALAVGCPVVVKAHERHPGTSELIAMAVRRAVAACNLPAGVFSMLQGLGKTVGIALVKHPAAKAVGFTGSRTAGRALFDAASARPGPIPVFAEMSSLNPVFILPGALKERGAQIAEGLKNSVTLGAGQFCTKPGLVFGFQDAAFDQFQASLAQLLETVAPTTMLHNGICESYHKGLARVSGIEGVKFFGHSKQNPDPAQTQAEAVLACTDVKNFRKNPGLAEEIFGPFSITIAAQTISELEDVATHLEGQLTASVHGTPDDLNNAKKLLQILEQKAGRLILNGFPTGVEVCPSMNHGGPYPATTDVRFTSVGTAAIKRFIRPISYQNYPEPLLPAALRNSNPSGLMRLVNGKLSKDAVTG
jgi:NADP-dependent aldehyde dehydrogenase